MVSTGEPNKSSRIRYLFSNPLLSIFKRVLNFKTLSNEKMYNLNLICRIWTLYCHLFHDQML